MRDLVKVAILGKKLTFPDPGKAREDGLLAIGGDLSPERLVVAYQTGIFPWSVHPITWWSPDPRAIFPIEDFQISKRIRQIMRQGKFRVTMDQAFTEVMEGCAEPAQGREETWISPEFIKAYTELHLRGLAHSVEVWEGDRLVGGVYGVSLGGFFAGESMFYKTTNASKVALSHLILHLREQKFVLFDSQTATPHTTRMGAILVPRRKYLSMLKNALAQKVAF